MQIVLILVVIACMPGIKMDIEIPVTDQLYGGRAFQAVFTLMVMAEHKKPSGAPLTLYAFML